MNRPTRTPLVPDSQSPAALTAVDVEVDLARVRAHLARAEQSRSVMTLWECTCDAAALLGEVDRLTAKLARERHARRLLVAEHARLVAAARATVAAAGVERNAAGYVAGELARHGQLPPPGATPHALLATPTLDEE